MAQLWITIGHDETSLRVWSNKALADACAAEHIGYRVAPLPVVDADVPYLRSRLERRQKETIDRLGEINGALAHTAPLSGVGPDPASRQYCALCGGWIRPEEFVSIFGDLTTGKTSTYHAMCAPVRPG